jgi:hypothetical protein
MEHQLPQVHQWAYSVIFKSIVCDNWGDVTDSDHSSTVYFIGNMKNLWKKTHLVATVHFNFNFFRRADGNGSNKMTFILSFDPEPHIHVGLWQEH